MGLYWSSLEKYTVSVNNGKCCHIQIFCYVTLSNNHFEAETVSVIICMSRTNWKSNNLTYHIVREDNVIEHVGASGGEVITKPGVSESFGLTSTTSPEIGEFISLVAFTLSTFPKLLLWDTDVPGSGSSTNTTSPRWSWNKKLHLVTLFATYRTIATLAKLSYQILFIK